MKLKYRLLINYISFLFTFFIFLFFYLVTLNVSFLILLILYTIFLLYFFSFSSIMKKKGEKKIGYIIDNCYMYSHLHGKSLYSIRGFRTLLDGKIYYIYGLKGTSIDNYMKKCTFGINVGICNNRAYKYVCSELKKIEDLGNGKFKLRSFPIDVYVHKGKYFFDLESVKLDMKD